MRLFINRGRNYFVSARNLKESWKCLHTNMSVRNADTSFEEFQSINAAD